MKRKNSRGIYLDNDALSLIWTTARNSGYYQDCEFRDALWRTLKREFGDSTFRKWLPKQRSKYQSDIHPTVLAAVEILLNIKIPRTQPSCERDRNPDGFSSLPAYYPASACLLVDLELLQDHDRIALFEHYRALVPKVSKFEWISSPEENQLALQSERPLELSHLKHLLGQTPNLSKCLAIPSNAETMKNIEEAVSLHLRHRASNEDFPEEFRSGISQLYDYLSCSDRIPSLPEVPRIDALVTAGARLSAKGRVEESIKILRQLKDGVIYLCGGFPQYESVNPLPVSEADILYHYYRNSIADDKFLAAKKVVIERRPRNYLEMAACMLNSLRGLRANLGRPVRIGLVTSPYGMRRLLWVFESYYKTSIPHIVESFVPIVATSEHLGRYMLFDRFSTHPNDSRYKYEVFVTEYLKLIGGRIAGEF